MINHLLVELDGRGADRSYETRPIRRAVEQILHGRKPSGNCSTGMFELKHSMHYTGSPTPIPDENRPNVQVLMCDDSTCQC